MRVLWLCAVLCSGLSLALAQPDLASDPRLQKPIAVWLKMEPLGDAMRTLSRATGVRLSCSSQIQAQKVAIFIPAERPAHEVLTQLARVLRYEWRVRDDENGYMLVAPDELRRQEKAVSRALREARHKAVQDLIRAARDCAQKPIEQLIEEQRNWSYDPSAQQDSYMQQRRHVLLQLISGYGQTIHGEPIRHTSASETLLRCLAAMPPAALNALLNGQWVGLSTRPAHGIYAYPPDVPVPDSMREQAVVERDTADGQQGYAAEPRGENPALVGVWMRLSPNRANAIQYRIVSFTRPVDLSRFGEVSGEAVTVFRKPRLNMYTSVLQFHLLPYAQEHPFLQSWREWATPESEWAKHLPAEPKPIDRPEPPLPEYRREEWIVSSSSVLLTTADVLERVAWLTGKPIVADAFRSVSVMVSRNMLSQPMTLLRFLRQHCWTRFDESGYLLTRTQLYWSRQRWELPEAKLRALERKFKAGGWLDLRDYVDLAAALTPEQVEQFTAPDGVHFLPAVEFPIRPLTNARGLRFLASLTRAQYQQALTGEWIPVSTLSPVQRQRFNEALHDEFPPVEALFTSVPEGYTGGYSFTDSQVTRLSSVRGAFVLGMHPTPSDSPNEPAFRLQVEPEQVDAVVGVRPDGMVSYSVPPMSPAQPDSPSETRDWIRYYSEMIQNDFPDAVLFQRRQVRYTLWLVAPPSQRVFEYAQYRHIPVEMPAAKASE
ncbi:MAG: hypothetical protein NZ874_02795 [Fimbriimonadales bacterium]|nr:hypothetical protein [Fimbriimonadales bacterium]